MGLLDYIRANTPRATTPRVKPGKVINEGLLNPNAYNKPAADRFKDSLFGGLGIVPGVGDVASGMEAADLWNRGDKGNAGLAALGMLPFVPNLVGATKLGSPSDIPISKLLLDEYGEAIANSNFRRDPSYIHKNTNPISVDADSMKVLDGYHRIAQAKLLGKGNIQAQLIKLSDEEKKALGLM